MEYAKTYYYKYLDHDSTGMKNKPLSDEEMVNTIRRSSNRLTKWLTECATMTPEYNPDTGLYIYQGGIFDKKFVLVKKRNRFYITSEN